MSTERMTFDKARFARAWSAMVAALREDHAMMRHYDEKYPTHLRGRPSLPRDLVTRIGLQVLGAYRLMRFCVEARIPLAPRVISRLIRHAYGSDIHWETTLDPGVVLVHGMGLALSRGARVHRGTILFHNVTLGMGIDPETREVGAPVVEPHVHIGPGCSVVGPVRIGARSKISANCFVRASVPPDSLVEAPRPAVAPRSLRPPAAPLEVPAGRR
jgi:serine O-acetyltransferase